MNRIHWIDTFKGIGILLVVIGHIWEPSRTYIYAFHMPLFFFISGYLYKPVPNIKSYFFKKSLQLLVPYLSFLLVIGLLFSIASMSDPANLQEFCKSFVKILLKGIYGGRILMGWLGVFWFITCLWLTQQFYNWIYLRLNQYKVRLFLFIVTCYSLAQLNSIYLSDILYPWSINVVLMAIAFYYAGHSFAHCEINRSLKLCLAVICTLTSFLILANYYTIEINMKYVDYGTPILNILLPMSCLILLQELAELISYSRNLKLLQEFFTELGRASLIIMFVHQPVQLGLLEQGGVNNSLIRIIASLFVSILIYKLVSAHKLAQKLFLGKFTFSTPIKC